MARDAVERNPIISLLVKLDSHYFLDLSPVDADVCALCLARHEIYLAKFDKTTFSITPIDSDWLKKSLEAKTVTLATVAGDLDTITASSKDLKAFCRELRRVQWSSSRIRQKPLSGS